MTAQDIQRKARKLFQYGDHNPDVKALVEALTSSLDVAVKQAADDAGVGVAVLRAWQNLTVVLGHVTDSPCILPMDQRTGGVCVDCIVTFMTLTVTVGLELIFRK